MIESLNPGTILLDDLKKVGWVVLKVGYNIIQNCDLENVLYDLNNDNFPRTFFVSIDDKERQMYYKLSETINKNRFDNGDN